MKNKTTRKVIFLVGTMFLITGSLRAADAPGDLCVPPEGAKSPFAGMEYDFNYVAARCVSAYPRVDDWQRQGNWEVTVLKRCNSIYSLGFTGAPKANYKEACVAAEKEFRKKTARWIDERKPVTRVKKPVCASTFNEGPDGGKLYACTIYFSSKKYSEPAKPLSDNAIVIDN